MATKKQTAERSRAKVTRAARAIINNTKRYDATTRQAIKLALQRNDADLAEIIQRAQRGETINDIGAEQAAWERKAQAVIDFCNSDAPEFITDAVVVTIDEAGRQFGIETPDYNEPAHMQRRMLADLFRALPAVFQLRQQGDGVPDERLQRFGEKIARIITHPQTPAALKSALQAIIVNLISNASGYQWADDAAGLAFLLPRCLYQMNEDYATGITHAIAELVRDSLPEAVREQIRF